jgi:hypothetical protein
MKVDLRALLTPGQPVMKSKLGFKYNSTTASLGSSLYSILHRASGLSLHLCLPPFHLTLTLQPIEVFQINPGHRGWGKGHLNPILRDHHCLWSSIRASFVSSQGPESHEASVRPRFLGFYLFLHLKGEEEREGGRKWPLVSRIFMLQKSVTFTSFYDGSDHIRVKYELNGPCPKATMLENYKNLVDFQVEWEFPCENKIKSPV